MTAKWVWDWKSDACVHVMRDEIGEIWDVQRGIEKRMEISNL